MPKGYYEIEVGDTILEFPDSTPQDKAIAYAQKYGAENGLLKPKASQPSTARMLGTGVGEGSLAILRSLLGAGELVADQAPKLVDRVKGDIGLVFDQSGPPPGPPENEPPNRIEGWFEDARDTVNFLQRIYHNRLPAEINRPYVERPGEGFVSSAKQAAQTIAETPQKLAVDALRSGMSTVPPLAAGMVGGPFGAALMGAAMESGGSFSDAVDEGMGKDEAARKAVQYGAVAGVLEAAGVESILRHVPPGSARKALSIILAAGTESTTEMAQEGAQRVIFHPDKAMATARHLYETGQLDENGLKMAQDAIEVGIPSLITGGGMRGGYMVGEAIGNRYFPDTPAPSNTNKPPTIPTAVPPGNAPGGRPETHDPAAQDNVTTPPQSGPTTPAPAPGTPRNGGSQSGPGTSAGRSGTSPGTPPNIPLLSAVHQQAIADLEIARAQHGRGAISNQELREAEVRLRQAEIALANAMMTEVPWTEPVREDAGDTVDAEDVLTEDEQDRWDLFLNPEPLGAPEPTELSPDKATEIIENELQDSPWETVGDVDMEDFAAFQAGLAEAQQEFEASIPIDYGAIQDDSTSMPMTDEDFAQGLTVAPEPSPGPSQATPPRQDTRRAMTSLQDPLGDIVDMVLRGEEPTLDQVRIAMDDPEMPRERARAILAQARDAAGLAQPELAPEQGPKPRKPRHPQPASTEESPRERKRREMLARKQERGVLAGPARPLEWLAEVEQDQLDQEVAKSGREVKRNRMQERKAQQAGVQGERLPEVDIYGNPVESMEDIPPATTEAPPAIPPQNEIAPPATEAEEDPQDAMIRDLQDIVGGKTTEEQNEDKPAGKAKPLNVGDRAKVFEIGDAEVIDTVTVDGVHFELYKPIDATDERRVVRMVDADAHELIRIQAHQNEQRARDQIAKAVRAGDTKLNDDSASLADSEAGNPNKTEGSEAPAKLPLNSEPPKRISDVSRDEFEAMLDQAIAEKDEATQGTPTQPDAYYTRNASGEFVLEESAAPITIPGFESLDLFVHKNSNIKEWIVSEGRTGKFIAKDKTRSAVIEKTANMLNSIGLESTNKAVRQSLKSDVSPRYTAEPKPKTPREKKRKAMQERKKAAPASEPEPPRTPTDALKSAAANAEEAFRNALDALGELFREEKLYAVAQFDPEKYKRIKGSITAAYHAGVAAGRDLTEFVRLVVGRFGAGVRPYMIQFYDDMRAEEAGNDGNNERSEQLGPQSPGTHETVSSEDAGGTEEGGSAPGDAPESTGASGSDVRGPEADDRPAPGIQRDAEGGDSAARRVRPGARGNDYVITDEDSIGVGGPKTKFRKNIEAIRLLKQIEQANRMATPEEQAVLVQYVGWGGLPQAFDFSNPQWSVSARELRNLLTYNEWLDARSSTQNAHYTSPEVVRAMWKGLEALGFTGGRVVEPAVGIGHFFGFMPDEIHANSQLLAVEKDEISARIARQLYQNAAIMNQGFEDWSVNVPIDLFISNVPFADVTMRDKYDRNLTNAKLSLHDFYFAKALKNTREGGLVAFITSAFTLDKMTESKRDYFADQGGDLIGAIRLPRTAFRKNAGTDVVTDILIFKKRSPKRKRGGQNFIQSLPLEVDGKITHVNEYFHAHPENALGTHSMTGSMYAADTYTVLPIEGMDLESAIRERMEAMGKVFEPAAEQNTDAIEDGTRRMEAKDEEQLALVVANGALWQRRGDELVEIKLPEKGRDALLERIRAGLNVRDRVKELLRAQVSETATDAEVEGARAALNRAYDAFVKKYGYLSSAYNVSKLSEDGSFPQLLALEKYDREEKTATKADIFTKRTQYPFRQPEHADNARDAMTMSLNMHGRLDFDYMARLTGKPVEALQKELNDLGLIFKEPNGGWQTREQYLYGNVRAKLAIAESFAENDPAYQTNVEALKTVQPEDITPSNIEIRIGSPWVPAEVYEQFIKDTFHRSARVRHSPDGGWVINFFGRTNAVEISEYGTQWIEGNEILLKLMNHRPVQVTADLDGRRVIVEDQTAEAQAAAERLQDRFKQWLWEDADRAEAMTRTYNDLYNNAVYPEYDGSHLTLSGISATAPELRPHQKAGIWRILNNRNTLLSHVVGAGKTWTMVGAAMELRRTGIARKPVVVVPNHLIEQWPAEVLQLYPGAKVLAATSDDFSPRKRQTLMNRIATGDWDMIIVPMSSFERVPLRPETIKAFFDKQLKELEDEIVAARAESGDTRNYIKELTAAIDRLKQNLERMSAEWKKDKGPYFDELGIDALFVDEAHEYKNLWFRTRLSRIPGVQSTVVQKTFDLYMKTQYINGLPGGRIVFATGTPLSNTMGEAYTMQRYLQPEVLEAAEVGSFDAWAHQFGEIASEPEVDPTGGGMRMHSRFAKFVNMNVLSQMWRQVADVKTAEMLNLPRPELRGGKHEVVMSPTNPLIEELIKSFVLRMKLMKGRSGKAEKGEDNALSVTTDGRLAATDLRLFDPSYPDLPDSKVNKCVANVLSIWKETAKERAAQIIWLDSGIPSEGAPLNLYQDIKDKLVKGGIPAKEVAFIHDADTEAKKDKLFADVRAGRVRVLLGSSKKLATGANIQERLYAAHHLDVPWKPAEVEQRDGRILRQGNRFKEVRILRYVQEASFDVYSWQTLERKAAYIEQFMRGKGASQMEDIGETALSYAEVKAIASKDPRIFDHLRLQTEVRKLEAQERAHRDQQISFASKHQSAARSLERLPVRIESAKLDKDTLDLNMAKLPEDKKFAISILGKNYTDPLEAGTALWNAIETHTPKSVSRTAMNWSRVIGVYMGFEIKSAHARNLGVTYTLHLQRPGAEEGYQKDLGESPEGNITRIQNLRSLIEGDIRLLQDWLEQARREFEEYGKLIGKPFPKKDELNTKREALAKLSAELQNINTELSGEEQAGIDYIPKRVKKGDAPRTNKNNETSATIDPANQTMFEPERLKKYLDWENNEAARIHRAAILSPEEGWFGWNKVFVADTWRTYNELHPDKAVSLDEFKSMLLKEGRARTIDLSRADLVEAMDLQRVTESEITSDVVGSSATHHFIRVDEVLEGLGNDKSIEGVKRTAAKVRTLYGRPHTPRGLNPDNQQAGLSINPFAFLFRRNRALENQIEEAGVKFQDVGKENVWSQTHWFRDVESLARTSLNPNEWSPEQQRVVEFKEADQYGNYLIEQSLEMYNHMRKLVGQRHRERQKAVRKAMEDLRAGRDISQYHASVQEAAREFVKYFDHMRERIKQFKRWEYQQAFKDSWPAIREVLAGESVLAAATEHGIDPADLAEMVEEYQSIDNWGLEDYITNIELGDYVLKVGDKPIARGKTRRAAVQKAMAWLETAEGKAAKAEAGGNLTFTIDTTGMVSNSAPMAYMSEAQRRAVEYRLKQEVQKRVADLGIEIDRAVAKAAVQGTIAVKPTKKWAGPLQKRKEIFKGEDNIFDVLPSYIYAVNKKLALDPVIVKFQAEMHTYQDPNLRKAIEDMIADVKGGYSVMDELVDKWAKRMGLQNRLWTRTMSTARRVEAIGKLGWRPVSGLINAVGGRMHTWAFVGGKYTRAAARMAKTDAGKALIEEEWPYLGISFASAEFHQAYKGNVPWYHPLWTHNLSEPSNRKRAYLATYLYAKNEMKLDEAAARLFARQGVRLTQFTYDMASMPKLLRGQTRRTLFQFKSYMLHEANWILTLAKFQPKSLSKYILANTVLFGPRFPVYFLRMLPFLGAFAWWDDAEDELAEKLGALYRGVFGLLTGADVTPSGVPQIGTGVKEQFGPAVNDALQAFWQIGVPAGNGDLEKAGEGVARFSKRFMLFWGNWQKAFDAEERDGWILDSRGKKLYRLDSPWEYILTVAGAKTIGQSDAELKKAAK